LAVYKISLVVGVLLAASASGSAFAQSTATTSHPELTDQQLGEQLGPALGVMAGQLQPLINTGTQAAQRGQTVSQQGAPQSGAQTSGPLTASVAQTDLMGAINQGLKLAASAHQ
jgi:hypothetical protein